MCDRFQVNKNSTAGPWVVGAGPWAIGNGNRNDSTSTTASL
jgi:hypothetical protein